MICFVELEQQVPDTEYKFNYLCEGNSFVFNLYNNLHSVVRKRSEHSALSMKPVYTSPVFFCSLMLLTELNLLRLSRASCVQLDGRKSVKCLQLTDVP